MGTYNARKKEGITGCPSPSSLAVKPVKSESATNSSVGCCWCQGKCCNPSPFPNYDCVCGPNSGDWKTPAQCGQAPPSPTPSPPSPTPSNPTQCTRTAAGQRSIYDPGCSGTGCGAPYNDPDCAFCVYDMNECMQAYGNACFDTYNARKKEGITGCPSASSLAVKAVKSESATNSSVGCCWCQGKCCNPSPFPN